MGNHQAGRSMVLTATALAAQREKTGQSALEILDIACSEYKGCDAEFDDSCYEGPFHDLLVEAFGPHDSEDGDGFFEKIIEPFSKRYKLV